MRAALTLLAVLLLLAVAGCGDHDAQELQAWMANVQQQAKVAVPPLQPPKTFIPFAYGGHELPDPFSPNKLLAELARQEKSGSTFKPDLERRKEALESYPLDTIKMVGTLQKGKQIFALLQVDRVYYQVQAGQHLGQNFGLVTGVNEAAVTIKEIVQDAAGDWVERMTKLELQDSKETGK
ncbi:pilus assembly protein PilP [Janthinobacterium agaricidamnosum]|uniref:Pilus assembly, PilP family protein n=1 Tax=Janthinobacterium agaricidamnosum NBRC 102515 = DSM 9628 TaxID=1349767 RepID=W0VDZ0_9BURK|nr:pilus assembly protein PilP [Janthinobacterium agaricidamnosum]CDG85502.1 pilus assembly, PilP family protein [Janthinobacterium agaricidamnosum NBRC 102515 = DSM 9628]